MHLRDTCLSVCVCLYVCVNVWGFNCVFVRPQHKYLIFRLYCVAVCRTASHATINTRGDRRLGIAAVCVGRRKAVNPSRYHWQAQRWEINIYPKLPQITSRDFCLHFPSLLRSLSLCFCWSLSLFSFFLIVLLSSFYLHCFFDSHSLHHGPPRNTRQNRGHVDVEARSCFYSSTHRITQNGVQTYTQTCPPCVRTHTHTRTGTHMQGQPEISIWGLSCQTWPMSLFCNYGSIYFFRSSRWVRSVPRCGFGRGNSLRSRNPA